MRSYINLLQFWQFWPSEDELAGIPPVASMTKTKTVTETKENNYDSDETCLLSDIERVRNYDSDETCSLGDSKQTHDYDSDETCLPDDPTSFSDTDIFCTDLDMTHVSETDLDVTIDLPEAVN